MIRGAKTIAEYAIRKWMEDHGFIMCHFKLTMNGNEAMIEDENHDTMSLVYDGGTKTVYIK